MGKTHIFWDNSNIHFVGRNMVMPLIEPGEDPVLFRTYFKGVFQLANRHRQIGKAYLAGSIPPENDSLWDHFRSNGIEVELLSRTSSNKENANDVSIQAAILRTAVDNIGNNDTFVVLTGDGAGKLLGVGFLADLERIHKMGFNVEVVSWELGCNKYLRGFAEKNGVFTPLEKYYYEVTFIKGKRVVKPLII